MITAHEAEGLEGNIEESLLAGLPFGLLYGL
jgi:hypothetical protein